MTKGSGVGHSKLQIAHAMVKVTFPGCNVEDRGTYCIARGLLSRRQLASWQICHPARDLAIFWRFLPLNLMLFACNTIGLASNACCRLNASTVRACGPWRAASSGSEQRKLSTFGAAGAANCVPDAVQMERRRCDTVVQQRDGERLGSGGVGVVQNNQPHP